MFYPFNNIVIVIVHVALNVINFIELESFNHINPWVSIGSVWLSDPLCYAVNAHVEGFVTSCIWDRSQGTAGKRDSTT